MNGNVLINKTDINNGETIVYFTVPVLNLDGQAKITSADFVDQIANGGYDALGKYLLQQLCTNIQGLLKE